MLIHKGCGGGIEPSTTKFYDYEEESGNVAKVPAIFCVKCGKEIMGDPQIATLDEVELQDEPDEPKVTAFFLNDPKVVQAVRKVINFYGSRCVERELEDNLDKVRSIVEGWR